MASMQIRFLNLLRGEDRRVIVVGDDYQSIYGFRAAVPSAFTDFIDVYDHPTLQQALQYNYRCILGLALFSCIPKSFLVRRARQKGINAVNVLVVCRSTPKPERECLQWLTDQGDEGCLVVCWREI